MIIAAYLGHTPIRKNFFVHDKIMKCSLDILIENKKLQRPSFERRCKITTTYCLNAADADLFFNFNFLTVG